MLIVNGLWDLKSLHDLVKEKDYTWRVIDCQIPTLVFVCIENLAKDFLDSNKMSENFGNKRIKNLKFKKNLK